MIQQQAFSNQDQDHQVTTQPSTQKSRLRLWVSLLVTVASIAMLAGLLLLIPWLLTFHLPASIGNIAHPDPQGLLRQKLLMIALSASWFSFGFSIILHAIIERRTTPWVLLQHTFTISLLAIALRAYPYWVNGLYSVRSQAGSGLYDPKDMQPFNWPVIGVLWRLVTIFPIIPFLSFSGGIVLFSTTIYFIRNAFRHDDRQQKYIGIGVLFVEILLFTIIVGSFFLTPNFQTWILD